MPPLVRSPLDKDIGLFGRRASRVVVRSSVLRRLQRERIIWEENCVDLCPREANLEPFKRDSLRTLLLASPSLFLANIDNVARAEEVTLDADSIPVDSSDALVNIAISVLLTSAFVGLVVLTGGIIYLAYTDWRDKRSLEAEIKSQVSTPSDAEVTKTRKPRVGPRGFGGGSDRTK